MKRQIMLRTMVGALFLSAGIYCLHGSDAMAEVTNEPVAKNTSAHQTARETEMRARMNDQEQERADASGTLVRSTEVYEAIVKGAHGQVPESVLAKARCIAVLPNILTAAVVVGGSHGIGVTSCKANNTWSAPAFVKLNALSFGAQLGGKTTDLILFVLTEQGALALKRGKLAFGADVGVVAGNFEKGFDSAQYGAVAYSRTKGAFAGVSISGGNLTSDARNNTAYYGKDVEYLSLLEGRAEMKQNKPIESFLMLLPK